MLVLMNRQSLRGRMRHINKEPAQKVNTRELAMYQWTIIPFMKHIVTLAAHSKIS